MHVDALRSLGSCCQIPDGDTEADLLPVVQVLGDDMAESSDIGHHLPMGPRGLAPRIYATNTVSSGEALGGEPFYVGSVLQFEQGHQVREAELLLYASGFTLRPVDADSSKQSTSLFWSPFSYVEKCTVRALRNSAFWAAFTLIVPATDERSRRFSFAPVGRNAFEVRDQWIAAMTTAINNVTLSLFPPHVIAVQPVLGVAETYTRIMAGYLLQNRGSRELSLIYAELHAYSAGGARLALYHDEWCTKELDSILLSERTCLSSYEAETCTVFRVDTRLFSSRTVAEKILWLRALGNTKMKLLFGAPDPTHRDLGVFRAAVRERLEELTPNGDSGHGWHSEPLLALVPRDSMASPQGDPDAGVDPELNEESESEFVHGVFDV